MSITPKQVISFLNSIRDDYLSELGPHFDLAIKALEMMSDAGPPENCVRVRIAVAVAKYPPTEGGKNYVNGLIVGAVGIDEIDDEDSAMYNAIDRVSDENDGLTRTVFAQAFVEVDVPLIATVKGRVMESKE